MNALILLSTVLSTLAFENDPWKAVYEINKRDKSETMLSAKAKGGETGNGGDSQLGGWAAKVADNAVREMKQICANHPETQTTDPCKQQEALAQTLKLTSWVPMPQLYLCKNDVVVVGGLPETAIALTTFGPCSERDAINFGQELNHAGNHVILLNQKRYLQYMADLKTNAILVLSNILHESLTIAGYDSSDHYDASIQWMRTIQTFSRVMRIVNSETDQKLVSLKVESNIDSHVTEKLYEILAVKNYGKAEGEETNLYTLKVLRIQNSKVLPDASVDYQIQVSLERLSDQGIIQTLITKQWLYNSRETNTRIPQKIEYEILSWAKSNAFPRGVF